MRTVTINYNDALMFNTILWDTYVARILDINKVPEFTSVLEYAFQQAGIVLTEEQQEWMDSILNLEFFQLNFADAMIFVARLLKLVPPQIMLPQGLVYIPSLAKVGAIEFIFPFQDGTYCYLDVLNIPDNDQVIVYIDALVERSATDPNISQENRDFINSLIGQVL
jgi:hypothetical protein